MTEDLLRNQLEAYKKWEKAESTLRQCLEIYQKWERTGARPNPPFTYPNPEVNDFVVTINKDIKQLGLAAATMKTQKTLLDMTARFLKMNRLIRHG